MPTEKKDATVAELKDLVSRSTIMIGAEYRGLTVKEMTTLRRAAARRRRRGAGREEQAVPDRGERRPGSRRRERSPTGRRW